MRIEIFEDVKYVVLENEEEYKCVKVIKEALWEQAQAIDSDSEAIMAVVEDVLDISEEPHGVFCDQEDTEGY